MGKILRTVLLFMSFLVCARVMAQNQGTVVKGVVTDEKGITIPGATVTVKGMQKATVTDVNGNYNIQVPAQWRVLVFSFIGMETKEVVIGSKIQLNVSLTSTSTTLNDMVVIGYGQQKRQDVNGAISTVTAKDIANIPQVSVDQMLEGKASGVTIQQNVSGPGSNTSVHIHGIGSLSELSVCHLQFPYIYIDERAGAIIYLTYKLLYYNGIKTHTLVIGNFNRPGYFRHICRDAAVNFALYLLQFRGGAVSTTHRQR